MRRAFRGAVSIFIISIGLACIWGHDGAVRRMLPIDRTYALADISGLPQAIVGTKNHSVSVPDAMKENRLVKEGIKMQIVYQLARRSVVKVVVKDAAGSGILWRIEDGIVVAANRHLLMEDGVAEVSFCNGETAKAVVIGCSRQYDIGFLLVEKEQVSDSILRDVFEAVPVFYETETEADRTRFVDEYMGRQVMQVGARLAEGEPSFSVGSIENIGFVPVFDTNMLVTRCFSKAGMSGGGVFDGRGMFLGMISGGDVPEDSPKREAEYTFSMPPVLIAAEYDAIVNAE